MIKDIAIVRGSPDDEAGYRRLVEMLGLSMYPEVGHAPLDEHMVLDGIYTCLADGLVFNAMDDGKLVGSLGAIAFPGFWYSAEIQYWDRWWYVLPAYRNSSQAVAARLKRAYEEEGARRSVPAYLAEANPNRPRHGKVASLNGFRPVGTLMRLKGG